MQRLKDLCGLEFVSERFPNIEYQHGALRTVPDREDWPEYAAAPGIVTRPAGASVLLKGEGGIPIVTEFRRGRSRVVFSADPIELHGDPRYQGYAHSFYRALLNSLELKGEVVQPDDAPVHCFRVPSQDSRQITVLVNHGKAQTAQNITIPIAGSHVRLTLAPRMSGIAVSAGGKGIQAVESSGDAFDGDRLLIGGNLHMMAIAFGDASLLDAHAVLLLPMGSGELRIPNAKRWKRPVALFGEISGSRWREFERLSLEANDDLLSIPIRAGNELSMVILCESSERATMTERIETWNNTPWR